MRSIPFLDFLAPLSFRLFVSLETMKIQDKIIAWNNQAVTLLENGQFRRGLALLRSTNRLLVQHMEEEHTTSAVLNNYDASSGPDSHLASDMISYDCTSDLRRTLDGSMRMYAINNPIQQQVLSHRTTAAGRSGKCISSPSNSLQEAFESDEDKSYIYQRFIRVVRTPGERGNYILSFIVLFNIALTYQRQVILGDYERHPLHSQQRRLRLCHESFNAYRCAFAMKSHGRIRLDTMILLALTNNMYHLSVALKVTDQADHLRELLTIALVMATSDAASDSIISLDGFWKTALTKTDVQWNTVPPTSGAA